MLWFIMRFFLGGGMPIGTLMLIEEDYAGSYAKLIMKYFLAEVRLQCFICYYNYRYFYQ